MNLKNRKLQTGWPCRFAPGLSAAWHLNCPDLHFRPSFSAQDVAVRCLKTSQKMGSLIVSRVADGQAQIPNRWGFAHRGRAADRSVDDRRRCWTAATKIGRAPSEMCNPRVGIATARDHCYALVGLGE